MLIKSNIGIIIPTHNRPQALRECIFNISPLLNNDNIKLILVLDGCTKETWEVARLTKSSSVIILEGDGNLFWGGAIAVGMHKAFNDYAASAVLWLNDDSTFKAQDILEIVSVHQEKSNSIIGGKLVAKNLNNFPIYPQGQIINEGLYKVPYLNGNFTLIPRIVYETIGNIKSEKFPHFADAPYLEKSRRNGFECLVVNSINIGIHYDIIRHLPLYIQALSFKGSYFTFWKYQLFRKTSKWFLPYRWNYTKEKFKMMALFNFSIIFFRDFLPVVIISPLYFLPFQLRANIVLYLCIHLLKIPTIKIEELQKELA